jgi:hypothetical protein
VTVGSFEILSLDIGRVVDLGAIFFANKKYDPE